MALIDKHRWTWLGFKPALRSARGTAYAFKIGKKIHASSTNTNSALRAAILLSIENDAKLEAKDRKPVEAG